MLVLSRRPRQSVVFPTLGISVQILRVTGQTVRVGVDAPHSVPVFREELEPTRDTVGPPVAAEVAEEAAREARHHLRGRLNTATVALYLAQRQLQTGLSAAADGTLQEALDELGRLEGELAAASAPPRKPARRRIRALLVEDNPHESALLESYLRLNGMDVANANDGREALDYLATHEPPDAVLLDMRMPRCDGPTTVAAIRAEPAYSRLKIFAVSGSRPDEVGVPTGPTGVDGWFAKPLNPARLVDTLAQAIG
jgi:carbon storage regulator CsrA